MLFMIALVIFSILTVKFLYKDPRDNYGEKMTYGKGPDEYLSLVRKRLLQNRYQLFYEDILEELGLEMAASRSNVELSRFGPAHRGFYFKNKKKVTISTIKEFAKSCYGISINDRDGFLSGVFCVPVIMTKNPSEEVTRWLERKGMLRPGLGVVYPVVVDLESGRLYYYKRTSFVGLATIVDSKRTIWEMLNTGTGK